MKRWMLAVLLALGLGGAAGSVPGAASPEGSADGPVLTDAVLVDDAGRSPVCRMAGGAGRPQRASLGSAEFLLEHEDLPVPRRSWSRGRAWLTFAPVLNSPRRPSPWGANDAHQHAPEPASPLATADDDDWGSSVTYFFLGTASAGQIVGSTAQPGSAGLTIPFFNVATGTEASTRVALPGGFAGAAAPDVTNDLQGWEWNGMLRVGDRENLRFHLIGGVRYLNFVERLTFSTASPSIVGPPDVFTTQDVFAPKLLLRRSDWRPGRVSPQSPAVARTGQGGAGGHARGGGDEWPIADQ